MRALIQRVSQAEVAVVEGTRRETVGRIDRGLVALVGVARDDDAARAAALARKVVGLRLFDDGEGRMNLALGDVGGALLVVSQFTLYADTRKGRRPSFVDAAPPEQAEPLVERFAEEARALGVPVETGRFRTHMQVSLVNDGPVTVLVEL